MADFLREFGGHLLASDGALRRTLGALFRPGQLTLAYLNGQRRRYLTPLRLFLSISLLSLFLLHWLRPPVPAAPQTSAGHGTAAAPDSHVLEGVGIKLGVVNGEMVCEQIPTERCNYWRRRLAADPELLQDLERTSRSYRQATRQTIFLALAPSLALLLRAAYWRRRLPFGVHMVTALHVHCGWLPVLTVLVLFSRWWPSIDLPAGLLAAFTGLGFTAVSLQRVYGGRRWATGLRMGVLTLGYLLAFVLLAGAGATWSLRQTLL
ncbi:DUF3667 domain-containing protein [Mitsuaria sp. WAJ17]|uniref:DUF3667 domain-containing protein n=1 Tax=Mitsuaria sp. WAJ17 TaxID=2761452 RepID=UPI00160108EB|nr:DUF3667 domain-containing protein [Mitsuaria sp. WAJ17]MBB2483805.1 DUF3667 domain-containing protein [Mitsuaria sp. WAJ17]